MAVPTTALPKGAPAPPEGVHLVPPPETPPFSDLSRSLFGSIWYLSTRIAENLPLRHTLGLFDFLSFPTTCAAIAVQCWRAFLTIWITPSTLYILLLSWHHLQTLAP